MKKRTFVRYSNRKLHEVGSAVPYTSMDDLREIIRGGDEIEVVDDETQQDLTVPILARLVYDLCRQDKDAVKPRDLIRLLGVSPQDRKAA